MISVIVPTYNRRDCLANLLAGLLGQSVAADTEFIVVDDCSTDDTAAMMARRFPQVIFLRHDVNQGPAVSRNDGVRRARGEIIVGFDSDVSVVDIRLLEKVREKFAAHADVAGLAFRILQPDGKTEDIARWWHPRAAELWARTAFPTDYFSGTAYAFRKREMEAAGLFPEILYMHYEEVELALRLLDNGESILYCPELEAIHHANPTSRRSEVRVFYKPRNQVLVAFRCYPILRGINFLLPRVAYNFLTAVWCGHLKRFFDAMISAVRLTRFCLNERRPLKKATWQRISSIRST